MKINIANIIHLTKHSSKAADVASGEESRARPNPFWIFLILIGLLAQIGAATANYNTSNFEPCHVTGVKDRAECVVLELPEDWTAKESVKIGVFVARIPPSGGLAVKPPLFILAGGPGEAASTYGPIISALTSVRRGRELIRVDQRGTGQSTPFKCSWKNLPMGATGQELADRCKIDRNRNTEHYTTLNYVHDIDAVRQELGYEKIDIWAGSYGTRVALTYAREYEANVGVMVLDSVIPSTIKSLERDTETFSFALSTLMRQV